MLKSTKQRVNKLEQSFSRVNRSTIDGYPDPFDENLIWPSKQIYDEYQEWFVKSVDLTVKNEIEAASEATENAKQLRQQTFRIGPSPPPRPLSKRTIKMLEQIRSDYERTCQNNGETGKTRYQIQTRSIG